jgi:hypothetical protein
LQSFIAADLDLIATNEAGSGSNTPAEIPENPELM